MTDNENNIDKDKLIKSFEAILIELDLLEEWNSSNAMKLGRLNTNRHSFADDMIELGLESGTSWAYGTDETNRDISIAQDTRTKTKKDAARNESYYYEGIGHLQYEIKQYISKLRESKENDNESRTI
jgi:hypothetical protein